MVRGERTSPSPLTRLRSDRTGILRVAERSRRGERSAYFFGRFGNTCAMPDVGIATGLTVRAGFVRGVEIAPPVALPTQAVQQVELVVEIGHIVDIVEEGFDLLDNMIG